MMRSRITKKGQVTIPMKFRELLKVKAGEKVIFEVEGERVVIKKAPSYPVADLIGLGKGVFGKSKVYQRKLRSEWEREEQ